MHVFWTFMFPLLPCLPFFYQTYSWIHLVFDFQPITLHHGYQKTRVCFVSWVVYFRFIHLLCEKGNWHTKLPSQCFQKTICFTCLSFSSHLSPLVLCVQSRQHNHAFYQLIIFSLANSAPVKHLIIYAGGIYRDPPHPDFCLLSLFVWKFLAFSFNYMHVCSFWVEGKKKKR